MPVYEYRCKNCGHDFEITQSMSEDNLRDCPQCGEPQLRKVFQPVGISFKGSGFYKNDSRSSSSSTTSGSHHSGSAESSSSESTSSNGSSSSESSTSKPSESKAEPATAGKSAD